MDYLDKLLPQDLTLQCNFENITIDVIFEEPTLKKLIKFHRMIKNKNYFEAIWYMVPSLAKVDFDKSKEWINDAKKILESIIDLVYDIDKNKKKKEEDELNFFPAMLEKLWKRYWKKLFDMLELTLTQLSINADAIEWNANVADDKPSKNVAILSKYEQTEDKDLETAINLKKKLKKSSHFKNMAKNLHSNES